MGKTEEERRQEALLKEYGEVCSNFRTLTDIRFKLLAFLPIAAAAAAVAKGYSFEPMGFVLAFFGLFVTIGLVTYNTRNDQLYDQLVSRAADIERSLNIPGGAFANRLGPWLRIRLLPEMIHPKLPRKFPKEWNIDHRKALSTIYGASIALWLSGVVTYALDYGNRAYLASSLTSISLGEPTPGWVPLIAIPSAVVATILSGYLMSKQKENRQKEMRKIARDAMERAADRSVSQAANDPDFIEACTRLSGSAQKTVERRADFYKDIETRDPKRLRYYLPEESGELFACHLIGLLTDLQPDWIYDCRTNRKGRVPVARGIRTVSPERGATGVPPQQPNITATFTEDMEPVTISDATVKLINTKTESEVPVEVSCDGDDTRCRTLTLTPLVPLAGYTKYKAVITNAIRNQENESLNRNEDWTFTTGPSPSP